MRPYFAARLSVRTMNIKAIAVVALALLACAFTRSGRARPTRLKGWQKILGLAAVIVTTVILINPEFLALGLLGDTAFLDVMVLAASLQMHTFVAGTFRGGIAVLCKGLRWIGIPSPCLLYLVATMTPLVAGMAWAFRQRLHRFLRYHWNTAA